MKTIKLTLGGQEHEIRVLPIRPARDWRKNVESTLDEVMSAVGGVAGVKFDNPADLVQLVAPLKSILLGAVDRVVDLVFAYSPELADKRDQIEQVATDEEAVNALIAILGVVYPLDVVRGKLSGLIPGPQPTATSKN